MAKDGKSNKRVDTHDSNSEIVPHKRSKLNSRKITSSRLAKSVKSRPQISSRNSKTSEDISSGYIPSLDHSELANFDDGEHLAENSDLLPHFQEMLAKESPDSVGILSQSQQTNTAVDMSFLDIPADYADGPRLNLWDSSAREDEMGYSTLEDIIQNIGNTEDYSVVREQLETLKNRRTSLAVNEPESFSKKERNERIVQYETVSKTMRNKWIPQIQRITDSQYRLLGAPPTSLTPTLNQLGASCKPKDAFEKELDDVLARAGLADSELEKSAEFGPVEPIKHSLEKRQAARLKVLLFHEHRRNKRLASIKSKLWHNIHKKSEAREKEKLMNRLDVENPDLAAKVRKEYETKFASLRMMRRQSARKEWTKAALRFGGKEMQKVVAQQKQKEYDERKSVDKIVRSNPLGKESSSDEDSDEEEEEESPWVTQEESTALKNTKTVEILVHKAKLKTLRELKRSSEPLPEKGLFGLSFMKRAMEKQRQEFQQEASSTLTEFDSLVTKETAASLSESEEDTLKKSSSKCLPTFSKKEIAKASQELELKESGTMVPLLPASKIPKNSIFKDKTIKISTLKRKKNLETSPSKAESSRPTKVSNLPQQTVNISIETKNKAKAAILSSNPWISALKKGGMTTKATQKGEKTKLLTSSSYLSSLNSSTDVSEPSMKELAVGFGHEQFNEMVPAMDSTQQTLINKLFVTSNTVDMEFKEAMKRNQQEEEGEDNAMGSSNESKGIAGWGAWIGDGISLSKPKKPRKSMMKAASVTPSSKKSLVILNTKLDRKLAKFSVPTLPYPYSSEQHYESTLHHPIGKEWNVQAAHQRFIRPKVNVRLGAVVLPLQYAKSLPPKEADAFLDSWSSRPKKRRTKSKF
ncbi:hypothetical protein IE077_001898 [Cardiosporidium cionae]|uniref:U3 small nucleolar RNA-associated protein 14 n=1 Tax=Cardiosporidium cionae TaxID=476202 RepID=A0ABQ7JG41_9APIC|nr:hypothetical protein IE077_001898 [Cardiosporidium cionae]|eukprot:KAF8822941.1 hypothetical protein IE077_001898 [Cardiosporidium cionae]